MISVTEFDTIVLSFVQQILLRLLYNCPISVPRKKLLATITHVKCLKGRIEMDKQTPARQLKLNEPHPN